MDVPIQHWHVNFMHAEYVSKRSQIPNLVRAPRILRHCPLCNETMQWKITKAKVFDISCVVDINIACEVCACGHQTVDGRENCLLRKSFFKSTVLGEFELCFTWCLLYKCRDELEDCGLFFAMLRGLIKSYRNRYGQLMSWVHYKTFTGTFRKLYLTSLI
jgi:hypothetical protein